VAAPTLKRVTTEYVDLQDRIRLSGDLDGAPPVVIWMTQRLLTRMLPTLLQWLEKQTPELPRSEAIQSFVQQAARAELPRQAPVRAVPESVEWLAKSVDLTMAPTVLTMVFFGTGEQSVSLPLAAKPLRQWLGIVHDAWRKAGWPAEVWPAWLQESVAVGQDRAALH
jgi:hypothetical protein